MVGRWCPYTGELSRRPACMNETILPDSSTCWWSTNLSSLHINLKLPSRPSTLDLGDGLPLSKLQSRKQRHTDEPVQQTDISLTGRRRPLINKPSQDGHQDKRRKQATRRANSSQHEFWNRLSKVLLIHRASEELNRRARPRPFCSTTSAEPSQTSYSRTRTALPRCSLVASMLIAF